MRLSTRLAAFLALILVGCGAGPDTPGAADGSMLGRADNGVVLTMWDFPGMGLGESIARWEAEHPGVNVQVVQREYNDHHEALEATLPTDDVPDVAVVEVSYSSYFRSRPQDFTDLRAYGAEKRAGDYLGWRWQAGIASDDSIIGLPTDLGGLAVAYRTDLFAAAGLPTDRDEVSALWPRWEDLVEVDSAYSDKTGDPFIDSATLVYSSIVGQSSEGYVDDDGAPSYRANPAIDRAWQLSVDAIEHNMTAGLVAFTPEWSEGIAAGNFAVMMAPAWMTNFIASSAPRTEGHWDIAAIPEGGGNWGGSQLTMPTKARHPELAWDLIAFLTSPSQQLQQFQEHGNFPSAKVLYDSPEIRDFTKPFFNDAPVGQIYASSGQALIPTRSGAFDASIGRAYWEAIEAVADGADPAEALFEARAKIDRVVADDDSWQGG